MGKQEVLKGVPKEAEVSIRSKVVEPRAPVHIAITFDRGLHDFTGVLTIERAVLDAQTGAVLQFDKPQTIHTVEYKGAGLETMSIIIDAPAMRGVYRVAFRDDSVTAPAGYDELIVQDPS